MRIDGEWYECDDGVVRPVMRGEILGANGEWRQVLFLVDSGADCTVISAAVVNVLGFELIRSHERLGGVSGTVEGVHVTTQIQLPRDNGGFANFRGQFAAVTESEALDMSILGRDITNLFAVIVDRPGNVVALIRPPHRYLIQSA
jgi:hypothetical protein